MRIDTPFAGHSEVKDQRVAAISVDQPELPAPAEAGDPRAGEALPEIRGKSPAQIAPAKLDSLDAALQQDPFKAANGGFDFGKLWHGRDMAERRQRR
jgi:hypothetical protein